MKAMNRGRGARLATGVIATALIVTACSSSADSTDNSSAAASSSTSSAASSSASAAASPEASAPSGTPLKVAGLFIQSGPFGGTKDGIAALNAWASYTNANGGIAGHPVEVTAFDTKATPADATAVAKEIVADSSYVGVVSMDPFTESAYAKVFSDGGVPIIGGVGFDPTVWGAPPNALFSAPALPNVFPVTTGFPAYIFGITVAAKEVGATKIFAINLGASGTSDQVTQTISSTAGLEGLEYAGGLAVSATQPDYTAECLSVVQSGADFVQLTGLSGALMIRLIGDCTTQGYTGYFGVSGGGVTPDFYNAVGDAKLAGGLASFPWYVDDAPVAAYHEAMVSQGLTDDGINTTGGTTIWATMELFKAALTGDAALPSEVTPAAVIDAYNTVSDETLDGLLPAPTTYTKGEPIYAPQCFWIYDFTGGKFTGDFAPTCLGPEFAPMMAVPQ